ncbi:AraC family transcriptional regulator [Serratia sp. FDAARGOS_506]|uniref:helix-turn-helix transcriptional regulator n=1 Tax=Serratia sp. FDAARGOS_506 TaxID=2420306 RepID=UPI000F4DC324|nr:AraC family transcriptional regulator [Serratia sp. FDAARGOS_506]AYZ31849.1 AraC family transcriptional regulator [Serratia sp. FDAARGOS_506]
MTPIQSDISIWRSSELQAELIHGRFVDYAYDVHTHETACFALLTEGSIRIKMRGSEFVAHKGELYAIDAEEPHAGWAIDENGWRLRTLYVDVGYLRQLVREGHGAQLPMLAGPIIKDPEVIADLYSLHHCSEVEGSRLFRDQAYLSFADKLFERHVRHRHVVTREGKELNRVKMARDFLDAHLCDNISLIAIAGEVGLPQYKLFRAFERTYGMTPHAYQRQARVRYAMQLLRQGISLIDAGEVSGFSDQAHFTRWFKRFMGITPGQYQKAVIS